tara:strand:+ start:48 stop:398 length:351 start_codon:yes stop_codon:yes gene_type:complete
MQIEKAKFTLVQPKKVFYKIKKMICFDEYTFSTIIFKSVDCTKLSRLKEIVNDFVKEHNLDINNFIEPKVYRNKKYIGYFSYNARFWREKYPYHEDYQGYDHYYAQEDKDNKQDNK